MKKIIATTAIALASLTAVSGTAEARNRVLVGELAPRPVHVPAGYELDELMSRNVIGGKTYITRCSEYGGDGIVWERHVGRYYPICIDVDI